MIDIAIVSRDGTANLLAVSLTIAVGLGSISPVELAKGILDITCEWRRPSTRIAGLGMAATAILAVLFACSLVASPPSLVRALVFAVAALAAGHGAIIVANRQRKKEGGAPPVATRPVLIVFAGVAVVVVVLGLL